MLPRHMNELYARLEKVYTLGVATINKEELKLWYGMDRLGVKAWRDMDDRWREIVGDDFVEKYTLLVGEADGDWCLAWGDGLITTEDSWFKNVKFLARRAGADGVEITLV